MIDNGLKSIPTESLIRILIDAYDRNDQALINVYAYELAYRIYKIEKEYSFAGILQELGYKNYQKKITR